MTDVNFKEIVLNENSVTDASVISLIADALGGDRSLDNFLKQIDYLSGNTVILGGYIGDELVCMNVFMQMGFKNKEKIIRGYQSGFSATSSKHRGKGLWPKLMKFSERYLSENNASFIYGFPNSVSYPVFIKKLGYESFDMHRVRIWPTALWSKGQFNAPSFGEDIYGNNAIKPVLKENLAWKKREYGADEFTEYSYKDSFAWGRLKASRKFGMNIKYFEIGGLELSSFKDLQGLLNTILRGESVLFCTISLNEGHQYFSLFKSVGLEDEPLIIKMLGDLKTDKSELNFFSGMRDTF